MPETWIFALFLCRSGICSDKPESYSDRIFYNESACREDGRGVALNLHLMNGKDYGYKCIHPNYEPHDLELEKKP